MDIWRSEVNYFIFYSYFYSYFLFLFFILIFYSYFIGSWNFLLQLCPSRLRPPRKKKFPRSKPGPLRLANVRLRLRRRHQKMPHSSLRKRRKPSNRQLHNRRNPFRNNLGRIQPSARRRQILVRTRILRKRTHPNPIHNLSRYHKKSSQYLFDYPLCFVNPSRILLVFYWILEKLQKRLRISEYLSGDSHCCKLEQLGLEMCLSRSLCLFQKPY